MRQRLRDAHRIVVKLGTHVVTHHGREFALGRVFAIVESLAALRRAGKDVDVVVVSSGAVGRGLVNYDSSACRQLAGHHSREIDRILGWRGYDALITRDNLVLQELDP